MLRALDRFELAAATSSARDGVQRTLGKRGRPPKTLRARWQYFRKIELLVASGKCPTTAAKEVAEARGFRGSAWRTALRDYEYFRRAISTVGVPFFRFSRLETHDFLRMFRRMPTYRFDPSDGVGTLKSLFVRWPPIDT
jgi:hypothetical protein